MICVTIGTNVPPRKNFSVDEHSTLKEVLEANNFDYFGKSFNFNGCPIKPADLDKTFVEHGFDGTPGHDSCYLYLIVKADNA